MNVRRYLLASPISLWVALLSLFPSLALAEVTDRFDYHLEPREIASDVYLLEGTTEDFSRTNGGNIVNICFIVADKGVILIDTGPSLRYAQQLEHAIAQVTDKPIVAAVITHHHPDHWFGNQHFATIPIYALAETRDAMALEGDGFADNLYRMSGDWMRSTQPMAANQSLTEGSITIAGRELSLYPLKGHTVADLAILDQETGVLFTGDLVFDQRAPTTPHANLAAWQESLLALGDIDFELLVPGHGEPSTNARGIQFTRRYLAWITDLMRRNALEGGTMNEVMQAPVPAAFSDASLVREELGRSVIHLYNRYEQPTLTPITEGGYN